MNQPIPTGPDLFAFAEAAYGKAKAAGSKSGNQLYGSAEEYGSLPRFAPGNALGLAAYRRTTMPYMFQLAWEPYEGDTPIKPTEDELRAYREQFEPGTEVTDG